MCIFVCLSFLGLLIHDFIEGNSSEGTSSKREPHITKLVFWDANYLLAKCF